jgi:hypothetical protein
MTTNGTSTGGSSSLGDGGDDASDFDGRSSRLVASESRKRTHQQGPNR